MDFSTPGGVVFALVSQWCVVQGGGHEINTDTPSVTVNIPNTSKRKERRQDRRGSDTASVLYRLPFVEVQLKVGNVDRPEGRQKVVDDLTKQTKEPVHVDRI